MDNNKKQTNAISETPMDVGNTGNSQYSATGASPMNQAIPMQPEMGMETASERNAKNPVDANIVETPMEVEDSGNSQYSATGASPMNQSIPTQPSHTELGHSADNMDGAELVDIAQAKK